VVARVGSYKITKERFERALRALLQVEPPAGRPTPPAFSGCIATLKAAPTEGYVSRPGPPTLAELKQECAKRYQTIRQTALDQLISGYWVIGGAHELGVAVGAREVESEVNDFKSHLSAEKYRDFLRSMGRNAEDQAFKVELELDSDAIRRVVNARVGSMTPARIAAYYTHHKKLYVVPQKRDIEIVREESEPAAMAAKRRLAAGASIKEVLKGNHLSQPIYSKEGILRGYRWKTFAQAPLNDAIMTAKVAKLIGPVKIQLGYYVFRVMKAEAGRQKPLAEVFTKIQKQLPEELKQKAIVAYIAAWRRRWGAKTDCSRGYVVRKCRQMKPAKTTPAEDPYTLN
jgi:foldase protein PrsA